MREGESVAIDLPSKEDDLKLFMVYPGDEVFLILESFPYKAEVKPIEFTTEPYSEYWIILELKAIREDWTVGHALSCTLKKDFLLFDFKKKCQ